MGAPPLGELFLGSNNQAYLTLELALEYKNAEILIQRIQREIIDI